MPAGLDLVEAPTYHASLPSVHMVLSLPRSLGPPPVNG